MWITHGEEFIVIAYASAVGFLAFVSWIIILAVSPAKWQTIKRMFLAFLCWAVAVFVIGWIAARFLQSQFVAELTGALMVSSSTLAAAVAGWLDVRARQKA